MQAVIFCGIQASGKTTFYRENFFNTHMRINLDMLRTRHREWSFVETCLKTRTRFVVDNTNPTIADRQRYRGPAQEAGFEVLCYYFDTSVNGVLVRNRNRAPSEQVPEAGIIGCFRKLQPPTKQEGFDGLYRVLLPGPGMFEIQEIK